MNQKEEIFLKEEDLLQEKFFYVNSGQNHYRSDKIEFLRKVLDKQVIDKNDFKIYNWIRLNGDLVKKGEPILIIQRGGLKVELKGRKTIPPNEEIKLELSTPILSPIDGILNYTKKENELISVGDPIFSINVFVENDEDQQAGEWKYFFHKLHLISEIDQNIASWLDPNLSEIKWSVKNGISVKSGDVIATINLKGIGPLPLKSSKDGYLSIIENTYVDNNNHLYSVFKTKEDKFYNEPKIEIDEFSQNRSLTWEIIGGYRAPTDKWKFTNTSIGAIGLFSLEAKGRFIKYRFKSCFFSIVNVNNESKLIFYYNHKEFNLDIGDRILFLFYNQQLLELTFDNKPLKSSTAWANYEIITSITPEQIKTFTISELKKWRVVKKNDNEYIEGGISKEWYNEKDLLDIFKKLVIQYFTILRSDDFPNYNEDEDNSVLINKNDKIGNCSVYLMVDTINDFYKIGISNNPEYREGTLQSEKPSIELLCSKEYPSRIIASSIEKALHDAFDSKRVRGEWFQLDGKDVIDIIKTLK